MSKVWVLDTDTKGTGARMVPLEDVLVKPEPARERPRRRKTATRDAEGDRRPATSSDRARRRKQRQPAEVSATPLPPGHVRKKATGEIGQVRSVDARAGTASVHWLKQGRTSTVPLTALSRR